MDRANFAPPGYVGSCPRGILASRGFLAPALALVLVLTGCASKTRTFSSPYTDLGGFYPETIDRLGQVLAERHPPLSTLKAESTITIDAGKKGRQRFHANLLVALPDKARLRGSRAAIGTLFEVLSVGDSMAVYFNREGDLFTGRRSDLSESAGILRLVGPDQLLRALLAERDLADQLKKPGTWSVRDRVDRWVLYSQKSAGEWQVWVVRKKDFLVEETLLGTNAGGTRARIRCWRYEDIDGEPIPTDLEIHLADPPVTVRIDVGSVRRNPPLRPEVFAPPPVTDSHRYPLSRLRFESPEGD